MTLDLLEWISQRKREEIDKIYEDCFTTADFDMEHKKKGKCERDEGSAQEGNKEKEKRS